MPELTDFELPNAAAGPDPFRLSEYAANPDRDAIVFAVSAGLSLSEVSRTGQMIAARYGDFTDRGADVVSILPEPIDRARRWNEQYELPFPLLADESKATSDRYDQPVRFGAVGSFHDMVGRMPEAILVDTSSEQPSIEYVHRGKHPADRPTVDDLLERIDELAAARVER